MNKKMQKQDACSNKKRKTNGGERVELKDVEMDQR